MKLKCLKFEDITQDLTRHNLTSVDSNLIAEALCHIPEVHIKSHGFTDLFNMNVFALIEKIADSPQEDIKLKKLAIVVQEDMNETILAKAVIKLETLCLVGSKISPLQENTIYRHILQSDKLVLKSLDVRRTSTSLNDVHGELQAEAVIRLQAYKAAANEEQAKKILDLLHDKHDPKTKHLLLIVRKRNGLPGKLEYCAEKMSIIRAKLFRFKVIDGV